MSTSQTFISEVRNGVTIVYSLSPWLIEPRMADILTRQLCDQFEEGADTLLMNLNQVTRLSSVFIRSFIAAGKKAQEHKATLAFCNIDPAIREVFDLTGLTRLYSIYPTENDALAKIGAP